MVGNALAWDAYHVLAQAHGNNRGMGQSAAPLNQKTASLNIQLSNEGEIRLYEMGSQNKTNVLNDSNSTVVSLEGKEGDLRLIIEAKFVELVRAVS